MSRNIPTICLGFLLTAMLDVFIGWNLPGASIPNSLTFCTLGVVLLGDVSLIALAVLAILGLLHLIRGQSIHHESGASSPRRIRHHLPGAIVGIALSAAFLTLNWDFFRGAAISQHSMVHWFEWSFRILGSLAVLSFSFMAEPLFRRLGSIQSRPASAFFGLAFLSLTFGLLFINARAWRAQYPKIHFQISFLAFAFGVFAAVSIIRTARTSFQGSRRNLVLAILGLALGTIISSGFARNSVAYGANVAALDRFRAYQDWQKFRTRIFPEAVDAPEFHFTGANVKTLPGLEHRTSTPEELRRILEARNRSGGNWNVLWIAVDTVRADHVSCYGYHRQTTKAIDGIASDGTLFKNAYSTYPTSNYAYSSALTSLPPRATPVFAAMTGKSWKFPELLTLPAVLGSQGYTSLGLTAFDARTSSMPQWFGTIRNGFTTYNPDQQEDGYDGKEAKERALKFIDSKPKAPWFLFVHFLEPHEPYDKHPEHDFGNELLDRYDSDIAWTDARVGEIVESLKRNGVYDKTIIVVFSDHGEEFLERGGRFHNTSVYDEQTRIPLIIRVPGLEARQVESVVSLMDVFPTLVEALGLKDSVSRFGRSLVPHLLGHEDENGGFAYTEWFESDRMRLSREAFALRVGPHKYIGKSWQSLGEFFDLSNDPGEKKSLVGIGHQKLDATKDLALQYRSIANSFHSRDSGSATDDSLKNQVLEILDKASSGQMPCPIASRAVRGLLLDRYFQVPDRVRDELGSDGLAIVRGRMQSVATNPGIEGSRSMLELLAFAKDLSLRDWWIEAAKLPHTDKALCAKALGMCGDSGMKDILLRSLAQAPVFDPDAINALAALGDERVVPSLWVNVNIMGAGRGHGNALLALPKFRNVIGKPARWIRDRVVYEETRHSEVSHYIVSILSQEPDPDALTLLLRFARDADAEVRQRALDVIKKSVPDSDLERWLQSVDAEIAGDGAYRYGGERFRDALESYTRAAELGPKPHNSLQQQIILTELALDRKESAANRVSMLLSDPKLPEFDRLLASRTLDLGPIAPSTEDFRAEIPDRLQIPSLRRHQTLAFRARITNRGSIGWRGGWARLNYRFSLRWMKEDDRLAELPDDLIEHAPLPETGVLPGETIEFFVVGAVPSLPGTYRPIITATTAWGKLPNDGIIYRHPELITVP